MWFQRIIKSRVVHTWIALEQTLGHDVGDHRPQTCRAVELAARWTPLLDDYSNVAPWAKPQIILFCTFLQNKLKLIGTQELIRDLVKYWEIHFFHVTVTWEKPQASFTHFKEWHSLKYLEIMEYFIALLSAKVHCAGRPRAQTEMITRSWLWLNVWIYSNVPPSL